MARLKQDYLPIEWDAIEECPDLQRVEMVIKHLPDEPLMSALEERATGRPDATSVRGVPDKHEMSRFALKLANDYSVQIEALQAAAVEQLRKYLPDLGEQLGTDTTALRTWARGRKKPSDSADQDTVGDAQPSRCL